MTDKPLVVEIENESGYLPLIEKFTPNIVNIFDHFLLEEIQGRTKEKSSHYPSGARVLTSQGIMGECIRKQFYGWKGEQDVVTDYTGLWKMDMGNAIHSWVGSKLSRRFKLTEEYPIVYHPEFMKYPIRGRIDNLITESDYGNFGVEVKSIYGRGMTNRDGGVKYQGPKDSHLLQAYIYLCVSRLPEEEKRKMMPIDEEKNRHFELPYLDFFVIYYISRDNAYRMQFYMDIMQPDDVLNKLGHLLPKERKDIIDQRGTPVLVVTDGINWYVYEEISFRDIVKSYMTVEKHLELDLLPPRDFNLVFDYDEESGDVNIDRKNSDWQCSYCPFKEICWIRDRFK